MGQCSSDLPVRERSRFIVEIETTEDEQFVWTLTAYYGATGREERLVESSPFPRFGPCLAHLWIVTGWLPDGFSTMSCWDDDAPGIRGVRP